MVTGLIDSTTGAEIDETDILELMEMNQMMINKFSDLDQ